MYELMYPNMQQEAEFYASYFNMMPNNCLNHLYTNDIDQDVLDIYIITFNSLFCIEYQIKTIRKFVKQKYNIIIIDNNNDLNIEVSK